MSAPVRLREDFNGPRLCALAKCTRDAGRLRRLLPIVLPLSAIGRSHLGNPGLIEILARIPEKPVVQKRADHRFI